MRICNVVECKHHTKEDNCTKGMLTMKRIVINGVIYAVCLQFYRKQKFKKMEQQIITYIQNNEGKCVCDLFASFLGSNYNKLKAECLESIRHLKARDLIEETNVDICSYLEFKT